MKPRLAMRVDNKLTDDGSKLGVELNFKSIEDFEPDRLVQQVEPLRKLVEAREKLNDLISKMDGNDKLEELLEDILRNTSSQEKLGKELGIEASSPTGDKPKEGSNE
jgi:type VI secretion system protein ImpB